MAGWASVADHETYMGLVETGVGLIPAGGGVKEFVRRAAEHYRDGVPETPHLQHLLLTIAEAKVSTSALEAFDLGYLRPGTDGVTLDRHRLLLEAKREALQLAERGYAPPRRRPIPVLGRNALSFFYSGIENNYRGNYITEYDRTIARKLAYVMCGGDLHAKQEVSPQYLLDLERSAFMELVNNRKTLNRIEHMLVEGEALRN